MLYDATNPVLQITGVEHMRWGSGTYNVEPREYSSLAFRIKGKATVTGGNKKHFVNTNDILYLPQNTGYTAEYTDTEIIAIHFITLNDDSEIEVYSFQNGEEIYKIFLQAFNIWGNKEPGFSVYVLAKLYSVLGTILENETKAYLPPHFIKAVSIINASYKNNSLSIDAVCTESGIGATVFRLLFKKHYQKTPTQYVTDLRIEYARSLISGGMSIENAAYESGFNDPKYFARAVKKRFGCTPSTFKSYGK